MVWGYYDNKLNKKYTQTRISNTSILYWEDRIQMNDAIFIGHYCVLDGTGGLVIGKGTQFAAMSAVFTHSSHAAIRLYGERYTQTPESEKVGFFKKSVTIGEYVYLGSGCKVLPGVSIGNYAVVGAGAIVTKDVPSGKVVTGCPAKIVGDVVDQDRPFLERYPDLYDSYVHPGDKPSRKNR
jgi:acetyltransferase-like isoleucine patch superfamily enzyme